MAAALDHWVRTEMELPPLPGPVLRRLCLGSCGPIWEFITQHVRHPRTVKKIRGNLLWNPLHSQNEGGTPK
ncbi:hypothetical protein AV530_013641 [Patagioenas fasciata monilis]|uniref:Uncharacterized protein n=1 Tax=Patagioenas fasciata monilis TaxID=372326 RepID=A0A1V4KDB7_PATFA|nr:hypothetical protein AV530_013641 [Patagioenas fasciata monilis]